MLIDASYLSEEGQPTFFLRCQCITESNLRCCLTILNNLLYYRMMDSRLLFADYCWCSFLADEIINQTHFISRTQLLLKYINVCGDNNEMLTINCFCLLFRFLLNQLWQCVCHWLLLIWGCIVLIYIPGNTLMICFFFLMSWYKTD